MQEIWFWQRIISPHMASLALELAKIGFSVMYVVEVEMTEDRKLQGWKAPQLIGVKKFYISDVGNIAELVNLALDNSVHICQGIRGNNLIGSVQDILSRRGLSQFVIMETTDDSGWRGWIRRILYRGILYKRSSSFRGFLAIGYRTGLWLQKRGVPNEKIYPFSYFMPDSILENSLLERSQGRFRFVFAGRLIPLKRVDWLIRALGELSNDDFELWVVGAGAEEASLRLLAASVLGDRVRWFGQLPSPDVPSVIAQADCLVLPSIHDGWGAVASEALMVGTPVICSDACGVAGVVLNSGHGGVFSSHNIKELTSLLGMQLSQGSVQSELRNEISHWARGLSATAGANYLKDILRSDLNRKHEKPKVPWLG